MSSSAFPFLDGRTSFDGPIARLPRRTGGRGGALKDLRRWLHAFTHPGDR